MKRILFLWNFFVLLSSFSYGQLGVIDKTFNTADKGNGLSFGTTSKMTSIEVLENGDMLALFDADASYNFQSVRAIMKIKADGKFDTTFHPGKGFSISNAASTSLVLPSGNILVGGNFKSYNLIDVKRLAMLNPDGSINTNFNSTGFSNAIDADQVFDLIRQEDGKIIVLGQFTEYGGQPAGNIVRINEDGTIDETFVTGTGFNSAALTGVAQEDGKILIGGAFTSYNSTPKNNLIRLNADGSIDNDFDAGAGIEGGLINKIIVQEDGKIIIGGQFTKFDNQNIYSFLRLMSNGSIDPSFTFNTADGDSVTDLALTASGKILAAGNFQNYNSALLQLNDDGSLDPSFTIGTNISKATFVRVLPNNKLIVTGLSFFGTYEQKGIARLNADGSLDKSFNENTGFNEAVSKIGIFDDGSIMAAGVFKLFNKHVVPGYVKLHQDGTFDNSFNYGTGTDGAVKALARYNNNTMLMGGDFTSYKGTTVPSLVRILSNGEIDQNFNLSGISLGKVHSIEVQPDGKILVSHEGTGGLVRLNTDGSYDSGFQQNKLDGYPSDIALDPSGKIIVAGENLYGYQSTARKTILRLNADGSLDASLDPHDGFEKPIFDDGGQMVFLTSFFIHQIDVQSNGKILVAGEFLTYNNATAVNFVRLNTNGTLDAAFNATAGIDFPYSAFVVKVLESGDIIAGGGTANILRLYSESGYDIKEFKVGRGLNGFPYALEVQDDGKFVVGGIFTKFDTTYKNSLIRINNHKVKVYDWSWFDGPICKGNNEEFSIAVDGTFDEGNEFIIEVSDKDGNFNSPVEIARISNEEAAASMENDENFFVPFPKTLPSGDHYYLRIRSTSPKLSSFEQSDIIFKNPNASAVKDEDFLMASPDNATYQWVNCDNNFSEIVGSTSQSFIFLPDQSYAVIVELDGCKDTSSCVETEALTTSLSKQKSEISFEIYPNPTSSVFNIDGSLDNQTISIINQIGVEVYNDFVTEGNHKEINIENFSKGIYYLRISGNEKYQTHKIIRQ